MDFLRALWGNEQVRASVQAVIGIWAQSNREAALKLAALLVAKAGSAPAQGNDAPNGGG